MADFDPDAYLAKADKKPAQGGFNPDAYLQQFEAKPQEPNTVAGIAKSFDPSAALQGFGSAASLGYLPQLQAAAGLLTPDPNASLNKDLESKGFKIEEPKETYLSLRDKAIGEQEKLKQESPVSYGVGQLGGAIASAAPVSRGLMAAGKLAPIGIQKAAQALPAIGKAALGGAATAAVSNPGDVSGVVDPLQEEAREEAALSGGITGGALGAVGSALKKTGDFIARAPAALKDWAELKAFSSSGAMLKDFRKSMERGKIGEIGREMIKNKLVTPGATFEDVADNSSKLKEKFGKVIGDIYDKVDEQLQNPATLQGLDKTKLAGLNKTKLNAQGFARTLKNQFADELSSKPGGTKAMSSIESYLDELAANGKNANIGQLQEFKEGIDDILKYNRSLMEEPINKQYLFKMRDFLKDRIQDRVDALDKAFGKESLKTLKEANRQYGIWAEVSRISRDRVLRENANRMMSLSDTIAGGAGSTIGAITGSAAGPAGAIKGAMLGSAAGAANKGARLYGKPLLVSGAMNAAESLESLPSPVSKGLQGAGGLIGKNPVESAAALEALKASDRRPRGLIKK